ncbi:uncharacterized protein (DUF111 family) [Tenggerimyces flavus]|nr:uncharacterized protein (DUF111 family) [Tenggerimyces flavus]
MHGTTPEAIHFHEVGALDAIADIVGVSAGFAHLGLARIHATPVAVGSGTVQAAHGWLPVPPPAVVELLVAAGAPSYAGDTSDTDGTGAGSVVELCTPTGAALLATHVDAWSAQPPMRVTRQGIGAGSRETPGRANTLRLLVGDGFAAAVSAGSAASGVTQ